MPNENAVMWYVSLTTLLAYSAWRAPPLSAGARCSRREAALPGPHRRFSRVHDVVTLLAMTGNLSAPSYLPKIKRSDFIAAIGARDAAFRYI